MATGTFYFFVMVRNITDIQFDPQFSEYGMDGVLSHFEVQAVSRAVCWVLSPHVQARRLQLPEA